MTVSKLCFAKHAPSGLVKYDIETLDVFQYLYDDEHAELKRIYTEPEVRGMGLGAEIIRRLEAIAKINGFTYCILETGELLEAACHVYEKMRYRKISNYGPYEDMPDSICMQRKI